MVNVWAQGYHFICLAWLSGWGYSLGRLVGDWCFDYCRVKWRVVIRWWYLCLNQDQRHKYHHLTTTLHLTLKMTTTQVVETSVTNNSLSKDYPHPYNHTKQIKWILSEWERDLPLKPRFYQLVSISDWQEFCKVPFKDLWTNDSLSGFITVEFFNSHISPMNGECILTVPLCFI